MSVPEPAVALTLNTQFTLPMPNILLDQVDWIVFSNNSPYVLEVICGGILYHIPAWYFYPMPLVTPAKNRLYTQGNIVQVTPIQQTIPGSSFTAQLFYTIYLNNETPPQTVPSPLGGGPIDLTVASSVVNTNNPPNTTIVFGQPVGDSNVTGATNIENNGLATFGDSTYNALITLLGTSGAKALLSNTLLQFLNTLGNTDIDIEAGYVQIFGSSSGTATLYMPFGKGGGVIKVAICRLSSFRNGLGAAQTLALPSALSGPFLFITTDWPDTRFLLSGAIQTVQIITALAAAGGTTASQQDVNAWSIGGYVSGADTIQFVGSQLANRFGHMIIIGF